VASLPAPDARRRAQYGVHERRADHRAQDLSQDILPHLAAGEPVSEPQAQGDGGIHVTAGDAHRHGNDDRHPDPVREGHAERADAAGRRTAGDERDDAARAQKHE